MLEVEQKYNEIRCPIYEKINSTIQAIPDFWLTAVCNLFIYLPWAISFPCQLSVLVSNPYITKTLISIFLGTLEMAICKTLANKFGLGMIWVLISLTLVSWFITVFKSSCIFLTEEYQKVRISLCSALSFFVTLSHTSHKKKHIFWTMGILSYFSWKVLLSVSMVCSQTLMNQMAFSEKNTLKN